MLTYFRQSSADIFQAVFAENLNKVSQLQEEDLKEIRILKLVRHRNEMKKSIKAIINSSY